MDFLVYEINEFPYEIQQAIKGLNNNNRQKILSLLKYKEKMSFSEILKNVNIERSLLASHLNKLIECLLIDHFYEHEIGEEKYSFYQLSDFGKRVIDSLDNALYVIKKETKTITLTIKNEKETITVTGDKMYRLDEKEYKSENSSYQIGSFIKKLMELKV